MHKLARKNKSIMLREDVILLIRKASRAHMNLQKILLITFLTIIFASHHAVSGMLELNGTHNLNNGTLSGRIITGTGIINVKNEGTISCDEFQFTGTINCNGKCIIEAKKAFWRGMFKKRGPGTIIINAPMHFIDLACKIALALGVVGATVGIYYYFLPKDVEHEKAYDNERTDTNWWVENSSRVYILSF